MKMEEWSTGEMENQYFSIHVEMQYIRDGGQYPGPDPWPRPGMSSYHDGK